MPWVCPWWLVLSTCYILNSTGWAAGAFWGCARCNAWTWGFKVWSQLLMWPPQEHPPGRIPVQKLKAYLVFHQEHLPGHCALLFAPSGEVLMVVADSRASLLSTPTGFQQSPYLFFWSLAQGQGCPFLLALSLSPSFPLSWVFSKLT